MLKELPSDGVSFTYPRRLVVPREAMRQDHGYGPWDCAFIKRRDGPVADPSRKDTKMVKVSRLVVMLCCSSREQRRFRPALCAPNSLGFPGKSA